MADAAVAGGVDLVAMTRAIIADPDLPAKARAGRAMRPCIGTQRGLHRPPLHRAADVVLGQPGHPRARARRTGSGRRRRGGSSSSGAGSPGWRRHAVPRSAVTTSCSSSAARSSADGLASPGERRGRERWARYIDWLRDEAEGAGAELRTGVAATAQEVLAESPDAVILATGSQLRSAAALPGPVPVLDVDVLLEQRRRSDRAAVGAGARRRRRLSGADRRGATRRGGLQRRDRHRPIRWSARRSIRRSSRSCSAASRSPASP